MASFAVDNKNDIGGYYGGMKENMKHGHGKLTDKNGDVYEGDFKDDQMHGQGTFIAADGSMMYQGDFAENLM